LFGDFARTINHLTPYKRRIRFRNHNIGPVRGDAEIVTAPDRRQGRIIVP
jgi:hypothetical protein